LKKDYFFGTSLPTDGPKELHKGDGKYGGYTILPIESDSIVFLKQKSFSPKKA
jgi:hypothetical protein